MKIRVIEAERWPYMDETGENTWGEEINIPDDLLDKWRVTRDAFQVLNDAVRELYDAAVEARA